ncbi:MAG: tetratricopeptide repeat protein [Opitutaceae bacterium]
MAPHRTFLVLSCAAFAFAAPQAASKPKPPPLDPKRIINESYGFLKERGPQMTANEYTLYEKVVPMAKSNPELVTQMLEGMVSSAEPPSPAFSFVLGNVYSAQDRFEPARAHYQKAVDRHPEFQRAWTNLGLLYYAANRFEDAVRCLSRAVELGENEPRTLSTLAYSHYRVGNPISAELIYMQVVTVAPTDTNSLSALAGLLIDNREYARAEPLIRRLVRLKPEEKSHWTMYAGLLAATGRRAEACATLELAASLDLAEGDALLHLGDMYADGGDYRAAEAIYRKLEGVAPGEGSPRLLSRVRSLVEEGHPNEAAAALEKISMPPSGDARVGFLRTVAEVRRAQQNWSATRAALEELLTLRPLDAEALFALGRVAGQTDDISGAELAFAQAAKQREYAYVANLELANLALRSRQYRKSVEYLEAALAIERAPGMLRHLAQIKSYLSDRE